MENGPFIDDFPIKTFIYKGFSMAMLNNQMVDDFLVWISTSWDGEPINDGQVKWNKGFITAVEPTKKLGI